jgi:hypothetical protein
MVLIASIVHYVDVLLAVGSSGDFHLDTERIDPAHADETK